MLYIIDENIFYGCFKMTFVFFYPRNLRMFIGKSMNMIQSLHSSKEEKNHELENCQIFIIEITIYS